MRTRNTRPRPRDQSVYQILIHSPTHRPGIRNGNKSTYRKQCRHAVRGNLKNCSSTFQRKRGSTVITPLVPHTQRTCWFSQPPPTPTPPRRRRRPTPTFNTHTHSQLADPCPVPPPPPQTNKSLTPTGRTWLSSSTASDCRAPAALALTCRSCPHRRQLPPNQTIELAQLNPKPSKRAHPLHTLTKRYP